MKVMTDRERALSSGFKGWFAGCVAAMIVLFVDGFVKTAFGPSGLTLELLLIGIFVAMVQFIFIAIFTAFPAVIFLWIANMLRLEFLVLFIGFGGAMGWLGNFLFNPLRGEEMLGHFEVAGMVAGIAAWYFKKYARDAA